MDDGVCHPLAEVIPPANMGEGMGFSVVIRSLILVFLVRGNRATGRNVQPASVPVLAQD